MSRSGYIYDWDDQWEMIRYRGAVFRAIKGKRGQAFLRELLAILDAMPEKRLIANKLETPEGVCALGAIGRARGINLQILDPEDPTQLALVFNIADALVREITYENDEAVFYNEPPDVRFRRFRDWLTSVINAPA